MPQAQIVKFPTEKQVIIDQISAMLDDMYSSGTSSEDIRGALKELNAAVFLM